MKLALSPCHNKPMISPLFVTAICTGCFQPVNLEDVPGWNEGKLVALTKHDLVGVKEDDDL